MFPLAVLPTCRQVRLYRRMKNTILTTALGGGHGPYATHRNATLVALNAPLHFAQHLYVMELRPLYEALCEFDIFKFVVEISGVGYNLEIIGQTWSYLRWIIEEVRFVLEL